MQALKEILAEATASNTLRVAIYIETLAEGCREYDLKDAWALSLTDAIGAVAQEAGCHPGRPLEGVEPLEAMAQVEQTLRSLSTKYERLRAAAVPVVESSNGGHDAAESRVILDALKEALRDE